jgi:hypothetical protein
MPMPEAPSIPREALLARPLVELADTLVDDYDAVDLLTVLAGRCVEILAVAAAGLILVTPEGDRRVVASSSEAMRVLELFELQPDEGPCLDCYRTGEPVLNQHLAAINGRWPRFAPVALAGGFRSVHALPMRLRGIGIGALNLLRADDGQLSEANVVAGRALADVATIAILQHGAALEAHVLNEQLSGALNSRAGSNKPRVCWPSGPASTWSGPSRCCATGPRPQPSTRRRRPRHRGRDRRRRNAWPLATLARLLNPMDEKWSGGRPGRTPDVAAWG